MRILVTGATGFVGSHLIKGLCAGEDHEIFALRRKNSDIDVLSAVADQIGFCTLDESGDNIYEIISETSPDLVIHLATLFLGSHTRQQIEPLIQSNILFPTKLLDAMNTCGVRKFINTGSFSEHFNCKPEYDPVNLYSSTKRAFENILTFYVNAHDLNVVTLKLFDTYGPHDPRPKFFSFLKKSLREDLTVDFSPGGQLMDVVHVQDVVEAYKKAMQYIMQDNTFGHETFFIGTGQSLTLKDIVTTFEDVVGKKINVNWGGRPYREREIMTAKADIAKAQSLLHWQPKFSLREGLTQMMAEENKK